MLVRKVLPILLTLFFFYSCEKKQVNVVSWLPFQPKAGDVIEISLRPGQLENFNAETNTVFIVYQLQNEKEEEVHRNSMTFRNGVWNTEIETGSEYLLLSFKFEDDQDRVEDNSGKRWTVFLRSQNGKIQKNSFYLTGESYNRMDPSQHAFGRVAAISEFKKELALFPNNYNVWFDLWYAQLKNSNQKTAALERIRVQFDSLKTNSQPCPELLHLGFRTNSMLLKNITAAIESGEKILSDYKQYQAAEDIELSLIYLKYGGNTRELISELNKFVDRAKNEKVLKNLNYQLGSISQQQKAIEQAIKYFQKVINIDKNDISVRLSLARLYIKKKDYHAARQMIREAEANCTDEKFVESRPWEHPTQRRSWLNLSRCQIFSTRAALNFEQGEYQQSIVNRKSAIKLGTPFPAFEWTKIGDTYFKTNMLDSAKIAYLKAVSINSAQEDAKNSLKIIYQKMEGRQSNFNHWLQEEVEKTIKASAKNAPDFELVDINDNKSRLSQQRGKVVVLTFWDSWSRECQHELPQLNVLKELFTDQEQVLFWAISVEVPVSINKFTRNNPFNFRLFHSGYDVKKLYEIIGFPTHVVIDKNGNIRFTHIGFSGDIKNKLKKEIQMLLDESDILS